MDRNAFPTLNTAAKEKMYMYALHTNVGTDFRDLVSYSDLEQAIKYGNNSVIEGFQIIYSTGGPSTSDMMFF